MTVYVEWADPATEVNAVIPGTHPAPVQGFTQPLPPVDEVLVNDEPEPPVDDESVTVDVES